jgi:hypothetical protein
MKVYIATSGSYSDYRINQVFLHEEDARAYAEKRNGGSWEESSWDEYEVHEGSVERRTKYYLWWHPYLADREASSNATGNPEISNYSPEDYDGNDRPKVKWMGLDSRDPHGFGPRATLVVEGWSKQDVLKVYSDERARYKAREEGVS